MSRFGELLRLYRRESRDPDRGGSLTLERLAELLSLESGENYAHQSISEWERGRSRPSHIKRGLLSALVKVLHRCGGLPSLIEANTLLLAGEYSPMTEAELRAIHPQWADAAQAPAPLPNGEARLILQLLSDPLDRLLAGLRSWRARASEDHWTSAMFDLMRQTTQGWSSEQAFRVLMWIALWLLTWGLMWPVLRWPFKSDDELRWALAGYAVGGVLLPLLIAWRTRAHDGAFWQTPRPNVQQGAVSVFTHQGAAVGFHVAYLLIVTLTLVAYYFELGHWPRWGERVLAAMPVILGYAAARQIPFNLWRAYGQLHINWRMLIPSLAFVLVAPVWVIFFYFSHAWLLHPLGGPLLLMVSLLLFTGWNARRDRQPVDSPPDGSSE
ncbi:MAG: helix-turn-helix domain-containing protein [Anaerolineales bacterium]